MRKTLTILITSLFLLTGCATGDYKVYADSQAAMQVAKSNAESARWNAMASIAESGDTTAKVAALMALQSGRSDGTTTAQLVAPRSAADSAKDWLGIILPMAVQGYGIRANSQVAITSSNNSARVSESTNSAFMGIAGKMQAPVTTTNTYNTTTSNTSDVSTDNHSQTLNGVGTLGGGSYSVSTPDQVVPAINNIDTPTSP